MWRRWQRVALNGVLVLTLGLGCGQGDNEDPQPSSNQEPEPGATDESSTDTDEGPLAFLLEGHVNDGSGASAQLLVRQDDGVRLTIGGGLEGEGFLLLTLQLAELDAVMGEHDWELELPLPEAVGSVSARLDGADYYSQGGQVHVVLNGDGHIEGDFSVELAQLPEERTLAPFRVLSNFETVSGSFSGDISSSCYSRVPAHATWLEGGTYCQELGL